MHSVFKNDIGNLKVVKKSIFIGLKTKNCPFGEKYPKELNFNVFLTLRVIIFPLAFIIFCRYKNFPNNLKRCPKSQPMTQLYEIRENLPE